MSERWVPVLAAIVGVLGGIGGAFIGGWLSNQGQEQRLKSEREAARQDFREVSYAKYLRAAQGLLVKLEIKQNPATRVPQEDLDDRLENVVDAEAVVEILAKRELRDASNDLLRALGEEDVQKADRLRNTFIDLAKDDIRPSD